MSLQSRREYLTQIRKWYAKASSRKEKSRILDEVTRVLGYHRKYAIQVLNGPEWKPKQIRRKRPKRYQEALPVIRTVWEALDYPCAERLHPVLLPTAEHLERHGKLRLTSLIRQQLAQISRSTLARRLKEFDSPKPRRFMRPKPTNRLKRDIPAGRLPWNESRPGALEIDLVEHNGGNSSGQFACTLSVTDMVTGYSRRQAILGKSQKAVFAALESILSQWPTAVHTLHSDNGSEFLNHHLLRFCKQKGIAFMRSRPYRKNDNPHVEQKNRQFVREIVGYARYDTQEAVAWLNAVYALLDPYANLFLPTRKVVEKSYEGKRIRKRFDQARTPLQRLIESGALKPEMEHMLMAQFETLNPLDLHDELEKIVARGPSAPSPEPPNQDLNSIFLPEGASCQVLLG